MIRLFAAHPTAANILMVLLLLLGITSVSSIVRSTFPQQALNKVTVAVPFPGASANDVRDAICLRLEDAVDQVDQVEEYQCESRASLATLTIEAREGASIDRLLGDVRTQVDAIDDMPATSKPPVISLPGTTEPVVSIAVHGDLSRPVLKDYSESLRRGLLQLPGVSRVDIDGFTERRLLVEADVAALRRLGLSVSDLAGLIRVTNLDLPAGELKARGGNVALRVEDERTTPADLAELRIRLPGGRGDIRLGEVATITDNFEYPNRRILFDGAPAAMINVSKNRADDALDVMAAVGRFVEEERERRPALSLTVTRNVASLVDDRLGMLVKNGLQGLVLVLLVLWLFFSGRHAFWVAMGLPVSFAGAFFVMRSLGYQFDMMTLVGLLIVIGIIVDDAIVIAENVASHREQGKDAITASVDGTLEVMPGVLSSFFTTFAIFLPLAFLTGEMGTILAAVPVVMLITLCVSLIEAFLILPAHLSHTRLDGQRNRVQLALDEGLDRLRDRAVDAVRQFVRWRYLGLGCLVGMLVFCVSLLASGIIGFTPLPELDNESVEARLLMPAGTPFAVTEVRVATILDGLDAVDEALTPEQPRGQRLVRHVSVQYGTNVDAYEAGDHVATITVDLLNPEVRSHTSSEIRALWRDAVGDLPDVLFLKFADPLLGPQGKPIELQLVAEDPAMLQQAGAELFDWLRRYEGVHSLSTDLRPGMPEITFRLKPGAQELGITSALLATQLRDAFNGVIAQEVQVGAEKFEVVVRMDLADRANFNTLDTFMVWSPAGEMVPLTAVASLEETRGYARLNRVDGQNALTLEGLLDGSVTTSTAVLSDTFAQFVPGWQDRFPEVRLVMKGESERAGETMGSLRRGFLMGFFVMFLILALQFRSYLEPLVVVIVIPLSMIGVVLGHALLGHNLTMPSMLGFVSLAGIAVNNSILLVTFVEKRLSEGLALSEAVVQASRDRFRAILLTSLTTVAGLLPLLTETSLQAKVVIPLAISLAFGLTTATLLVLFVIPAFYMILDDLGVFHRHAELTAQPA